VAELEAAFEARGGRGARAAPPERAASGRRGGLQAQQRPLQDAERALAAARVELAGHEHELATHERRCRELEAQLARLKARREGAEARRDESVRRLREAEQARDTTWQDVWSMEHDQLRLEGPHRQSRAGPRIVAETRLTPGAPSATTPAGFGDVAKW
jgi:chromosome segregation ATPase